MTCQCPLTSKYGGNIGVEKLFASDIFFDELRFMDENTYDVLKELNNEYKVTIFSTGTAENISKKSIWLKKNLPFIKHFIFVDLDTPKWNFIPNNCTYMEDNDKNLYMSKAKRQICYVQREFDWNKSFGGEKVYSWLEVKQKL